METKEEAIRQIRYLMQKFSITVSDLSETDQLLQPTEKKNNIIRKFLAFLGGIFILTGLCVYMTERWDLMNSAARIIITLGVGIALFIFSVVASGDKRYEKILTPFFLLAALFETIGLFVTIHECFPEKQDWHKAAIMVFGALFIQQLLTFSKYARSSLLFLILVFGTALFSTLFDYIRISDHYAEITIGLSLLLIAYGIDQTKHKSITPVWYLFASAAFLSGLFSVLEGKAVESLFLGASIVIIYMSTLVRSRMLLFSGTVSLIFYIGYFTEKHFANSIGWPLSLILFGILLLAISMVAIRIGRTIK